MEFLSKFHSDGNPCGWKTKGADKDRIWMRLLVVLIGLLIAFPAHAKDRDILIIAHRGASGERPEHTLAAYERAIDQGADYIEPDLVVTRDGVLVARHENEISGTTDVADHPQFSARRTTKSIDGREVAGWFAEDFTLAELRTLRARERLPQLRPANARFDGLYPVPTFAEIIALVKAKEAETGRRIGLYPELKHPTFLDALGFDTSSLLLRELAAGGYALPTDPVFIQSFEVGPLQALRERTELRLVQLVAGQGAPADRPAMTYQAMVTPAGLAEIASYADAVGAELGLILDQQGRATSLPVDASEAGLEIHAWTLRKENAFLPARLQIGSDPASPGCFTELLELLLSAGVDGVFTDDPALAADRVATSPSACGTE